MVGALFALNSTMAPKPDGFVIAVCLWGCVPYAVYGLATTKTKNNGAIIGGGLLMLGVDIFVRASIMFFPGSSTAALAFLFIPFWLIVLIMPLGMAGGWVVGQLVEIHRNAQKR